jgi:hypothetical protein
MSLETFSTLPLLIFYILVYYESCGPGSSVSIATDYGLDDPGIESRNHKDKDCAQSVCIVLALVNS